MAKRGDELWMWLVLVFGAGSKRLWNCADGCVDAQKLCEAAKAHELTGMNDGERDRADRITFEDAQKLIETAENDGIQVVAYGDENYPERLKELAAPPAVLFCRGDTRLMNEGSILHMVGTRQPSKYTLSLVNVMCAELAVRGFTISSGGAEGVDAKALETALGRGGRALMVCPAPLESERSCGNEELRELVAEKGLMISEYPTGYKGMMNFRRRNEVAVALSSAVIIAEAGEQSKGLDNVKQAQALGRPVMVVPPHLLYSERYFGQKELLRQGYTAIFDGEDAVRVLTECGRVEKGSYGLQGGSVKISAEPAKKQRKNTREKPVHKTEKPDYSGLGEQAKAICGLLEEHGSLLADELAEKTGLPVLEVLMHLTELELEGLAESLPGKQYRLKS